MKKGKAGASARLRVEGSLWLTLDGERLASAERMALLRAVADQGSITQAAKAVGLSYKGAWDAIEAMSQLSGNALLTRSSGGRGGGGTQLTPHGVALLARWEAVQAVHQRFVALLDAGSLDLSQDFHPLQVLNLKTSARNQWLGAVHALHSGAVNDAVEVQLASGQRLHATVTRESAAQLGLRVGLPVLVLVKASAGLVATRLDGQPGLGVAIDNRLDGTVAQLQRGAVNAELTLACDGGLQVVAQLPLAALEALSLRIGAPASVLLKASDLLLATLA